MHCSPSQLAPSARCRCFFVDFTDAILLVGIYSLSFHPYIFTLSEPFDDSHEIFSRVSKTLALGSCVRELRVWHIIQTRKHFLACFFFSFPSVDVGTIRMGGEKSREWEKRRKIINTRFLYFHHAAALCCFSLIHFGMYTKKAKRREGCIRDNAVLVLEKLSGALTWACYGWLTKHKREKGGWWRRRVSERAQKKVLERFASWFSYFTEWFFVLILYIFLLMATSS